MNVVGVDPAPSKGLAVFDGTHRHVPIQDARSYVNGLTEMQDLLVCWDSPLTGPPTNVLNGGAAQNSDFTQRPIESFFSTNKFGFKAPKGISVRGYSGCPHWTLSRSVLGLPRVGPFDAQFSALPLSLITTDTPPTQGRHVVEVHPAVALWLWTQGRRSSTDWEYKKRDDVMRELWDLLRKTPTVKNILPSMQPCPKSDDELDAIVAYLLGTLWLRKCKSVILLGDLDRGAFLLPNVDGLQNAWAAYCKRRR